MSNVATQDPPAVKPKHVYRISVKDLIQKSLQLQSEITQTDIVLDTVKVMKDDKRLFKMIGGSLIPKTVAELTEDLTEDIQNLKNDMAQVNDTLKKVEEARIKAENKVEE